jgi:Prokaryotic N-terminal methylation motif
MKKNQNGFSAIEALLVLVILGIIGFTGYYVWHAKQNTDKNLAPDTSSVPVTKKTSTSTVPVPSGTYLVIKEWGVKIATPSPINDATYQIVINNNYVQPWAFLSTAALDASADCKAYSSQGASAQYPMPTFQHIVRFGLTDATSLDEGLTTITAQQAAQQRPATYKQVGNYVYHYGHGNGMPCQEETAAQEDAFAASFSTIAPAQ